MTDWVNIVLVEDGNTKALYIYPILGNIIA